MIDEPQARTISEITALYVKAGEFENEFASDGLKFSLWAAALATAGFGLLLLNANNIALSSWLGRTVGLYLILGIQLILAASIAAAGVIHNLVNARLRSSREYINLLNIQIARVLTGKVSDAGDDIVRSVTYGRYLTKDDQEDFNMIAENTNRLDKWLNRTGTVQKLLVGIAFVALLIVGTPSTR